MGSIAQHHAAPEDLGSLSYRALLGQCTKAHLGEELLQDLYKFDFKAFLNYEVDYIIDELPLFFEWIKEQVCPGLKFAKEMPTRTYLPEQSK